MSKKIFLSTIVLTILLGALAACTAMPRSPGPMPEMAATETPPQPEPGKLTIVDARARPAPLAGGTGAIYFTVLNGLDNAVQLVPVSSPAAAVVETHETINENGVMKMLPLPDGYSIPAGGTLVLAPGGKHIMLIDLTKPLVPGDTLELTVRFDSGEPMVLNVPVLDMQMSGMNMGDAAAAQDAMAGHNQGAMAGHDHGMMNDADHEAMMGLLKDAAPEVKAAILALPIEAIHHIDESLKTGTLDPAFTPTVSDLLDLLKTTPWPQGLQEHIEEMRATATDLLAALEAGDAATAAPLAADLHAILHEMEKVVKE